MQSIKWCYISLDAELFACNSLVKKKTEYAATSIICCSLIWSPTQNLYLLQGNLRTSILEVIKRFWKYDIYEMKISFSLNFHQMLEMYKPFTQLGVIESWYQITAYDFYTTQKSCDEKLNIPLKTSTQKFFRLSYWIF